MTLLHKTGPIIKEFFHNFANQSKWLRIGFVDYGAYKRVGSEYFVVYPSSAGLLIR